MKHLRNLLLSVLVIIIAFSAFGCQAKAFKTMAKDLKENGTYSETIKSYSINLGDGVTYKYDEDDEEIILKYSDYLNGTFMAFEIVFDKELSGEYSWNMNYDSSTYRLYGELTASECSSSTSSLYYDSSKSTDSPYSYINSSLRSMAASMCKICLYALDDYFTENNLDVTLSDLGFNV